LWVTSVDAVDPSPGTLARGQRLPGGDQPGLTWILGRAEDAPLRRPYGLISAAASLRWMDCPIVLPRFRDLLAPRGVLAIVEQHELPNPWDDPLREIIGRYSTNRRHRPYDLVAELVDRQLFRELGRFRTRPVPFAQPVAAYVESFHGRNGFSRDRMSVADATDFDAAVAGLVAPHTVAGKVRLSIAGEVIWGAPAPTRAGGSAAE
jgi:hypothetical protein